MKFSLMSKAIGVALFASISSQANALSFIDTLYAVNQNNIAVIDTVNLSTSYINFTGLKTNEKVLGFDIRPTDGQAYLITDANNLHTISLTSGSILKTTSLTGASLFDKSIGVDFNPQADFAGVASLRVVTNTGENYAVNATTGLIGNLPTVDNPRNIGIGFTAVAYTNSAFNSDPRLGTPQGPNDFTDLYYINSDNDTLNIANLAFNAPQIRSIGSLGVDVINANGFDILGASGNAYALLNVNGSFESNLYKIDLSNGASTFLTKLNGPYNGLSGITTAVPEPESYALFMVGLGLIAGIARKRSKA